MLIMFLIGVKQKRNTGRPHWLASRGRSLLQWDAVETGGAGKHATGSATTGLSKQELHFKIYLKAAQQLH